MRILVLWANESATNLGVRALAEGAKELALRAFPDAEVLTHGTGGPDLPGNDGPIAIGRWQSLVKNSLTKKGEALRWLRSFDLILDTRAGDSFTDIYGLPNLRKMSIVPLTAAALGVPIALTPQTVGPFNSREGKAWARVVLRAMDAVMVRDTASVGACSELGLRSAPILATDMAFAISRPEPDETHDVLFNVSGLLWRENPHVDHRKYQATVRKVYEGLRDQGRQVALLEHVLHQGGSTFDTDSPACEELATQVKDDVKIITPDSLSSVRSTVAGASLVLGARMHACLNSLSVGTPTIPMAYSRKFAPLFDALDWPYTVDLREKDNAADEILQIAGEETLHQRAQESLKKAHDMLDVAAAQLRSLV